MGPYFYMGGFGTRPYFLPSGPEGIRTPGLLSAIEARSQLRYRPILWASGILPEAGLNVKKSLDAKNDFPATCMKIFMNFVRRVKFQ
jgi:hypothetical protein